MRKLPDIHQPRKDIQNNRLVVVQGQNHPMLFNTKLNATNLHWIYGNLPVRPFYCQAKIRYRQPDQRCHVFINENRDVSVNFEKPQYAITSGQSIVFYDKEICLGGGIIL